MIKANHDKIVTLYFQAIVKEIKSRQSRLIIKCFARFLRAINNRTINNFTGSTTKENNQK